MVDPGVVIIGAEMDALQLAALLPKSLASTAKVVDSTGGWLSRWSRAWRAAGVDYLRTPVTKHPGPQPGSFAAWIDIQGRTQVGMGGRTWRRANVWSGNQAWA